MSKFEEDLERMLHATYDLNDRGRVLDDFGNTLKFSVQYKCGAASISGFEIVKRVRLAYERIALYNEAIENMLILLKSGMQGGDDAPHS